eukprot:2003675-Rhodomonas_salina.1
MVAPAVEEVFGVVAYELRDVRFEKSLYLEEGRLPTVRLTIEGVGGASEPDGPGRRTVTIASAGEEEGEWSVHARMSVLGVWEERLDVEEIMGRCGAATECGEEFYETLGNACRGDFRTLAR